MASNVGNSNGFDSVFVAETPAFESDVVRTEEDINVVVNEHDVAHSAMEPIDNVSSDFDNPADVNVDHNHDVNVNADVGVDLNAANDVAASSLEVLASRLSAKFAMLDVQIKCTKASSSPMYFLVATCKELRVVGLGEVYVVVQERNVVGTKIEILAKDKEMKSKSCCLFTKYDVELRLIASNQVVQNESHNGIDELCNGTVLMQALNDNLVCLCKGFSANSNNGGVGLVDRSNDCLRVVLKQEDKELVCANCSKWLTQIGSKKDRRVVCKGEGDSDVLDNDNEGVKKGIVNTITFPLSNKEKDEFQARLDELKSSGLITVSPATENFWSSMETATVSRPRVASVAKTNSMVSAFRSLHGQIETGVIHLEKLPSKSARLDARSAQRLINEYRLRKQKAAMRQEERQKELGPSKRVMRKCKICLFQHTNKIAFDKHVEAHEQRFDLKAMVKCPACQIDISKIELNTHYQEQHDKEKAVCIECLLVMTPIELRRNHLDRIHYFTLKTKLCPACGQSFRTDLELDIHYSVNHDPNAFGGICDHCGHSFKHKKLLEKHIARHHSNTETGVIRCPFCDQVFNKDYSWRNHIRTHAVSKPYRCRFCDFSSVKRLAVVPHMKNHHFPEATVDDVIGDGSYTYVDKFGHELKRPNIKDYVIKKVDYERMVEQGLLPPSTPVDHANMKEEQM